MEFAAKIRKPLIVVAPDVKAEALTHMVVNHLNGKVKMCAVKKPMIDQEGHMSVLEDIAAYTGATIVSEQLGMKLRATDPVAVVGKVDEVQIDSKRAVFLGGHGTTTEQRIDFLTNFMEDNIMLGEFDLDAISERVSKLRGGLIVVQPGGSTKVEHDECSDRLEDALCAVRAALKSGYLPGGGSALLHASRTLKVEEESSSYRYGVEVVRKSCEAPFRKLVFNKESKEAGGLIE